jgi:hypothetical protein
MRYYLGQTEYKWTHARTNIELLWVRREIGEELYAAVDRNGWSWKFLRSNSTRLPGDVYCRCDIYVDSHDDRLDSVFMLQFPSVTVIQ